MADVLLQEAHNKIIEAKRRSMVAQLNEHRADLMRRQLMDGANDIVEIPELKTGTVEELLAFEEKEKVVRMRYQNEDETSKSDKTRTDSVSSKGHVAGGGTAVAAQSMPSPEAGRPSAFRFPPPTPASTLTNSTTEVKNRAPKSQQNKSDMLMATMKKLNRTGKKPGDVGAAKSKAKDTRVLPAGRKVPTELTFDHSGAEGLSEMEGATDDQADISGPSPLKMASVESVHHRPLKSKAASGGSEKRKRTHDLDHNEDGDKYEYGGRKSRRIQDSEEE